MEVLLFDTETTGLLKPNANDLSEQPEIIEIYCVKINEKYEMLGEFESFIKPKKPISKEITEITGIDDSMVADAPSFIEIYKPLAEFFTGSDRLVAHNLPFDRGMLSNELKRCDLLLKFPWPRDHYCTVEHSMHIKGHRLSLSQLHKLATGNPLENAHRAKNDVMGLVRGYHWLIESTKAMTGEAS